MFAAAAGPGPAAKLAFTVQPSSVVAGAVIGPAVVAAVQDAAGNPVTTATNSVTVVIGTNPGGGTLSGTATVSAVNGLATFSTLSIDKAGTGYTLSATATGLTGATSGAFNVTITAGAPSKLVITVQPSSVAAGAVISPAVVVAVQDAAGNPVTTATNSVTVAIGTNPAAGTLSGTMTVSAVNGLATFSTLSIDKAGTGYTLSATATGLTGATSGAFNVTITAGAPSKLVMTVQPSSVAAGAVISPAVVVAVQDAAGNPVTTATNSVTVAIGTNPAGGTLSGTMTVSAVNGLATFSTLSIDQAGTGYTLSATATGLTAAYSSAFNVTTVRVPSKLAFTFQPYSVRAGQWISPAVVVAVQDAAGNTVTTATNSITMAIGTNPSGGTLSGITTVSAVNGLATFTQLKMAGNVGTGYTLGATATGLTGATSAAFDITAGDLSSLVFTVQPSTVVAGAAISPAVVVAEQDAWGNTVTTKSDAIRVVFLAGTNPAGAALSGTTTVTAVRGVATFSTLSVDKAGTGYQLQAETIAGAGISSAFSVISAGRPSKLAFTVQPSIAAAGVVIWPPIVVVVQDAAGNTVNTTSDSITLAIGTNPAGGTLSGTTTVSAVNGVARFSTLSIDKVGTGYTLSATATGLTTAYTGAFDVITERVPSKLAFTVQPSSVVAGAVIGPAVVVAVQDAAGNTATTATNSITVAIGTNAGGGTLSGIATVSAENGLATFSNLSIDRVGTGYTLIAASGGFSFATSSAFNVTVGTPSKLAFTVQPSNVAGGAVISPPVVVAVQDAAGNPVTTATNSITVTGGCGTLSGTTTTVSAVNGLATFSNVSVDKAGTGCVLGATASGLTPATSNAFSVTVGVPAKLAFSQMPGGMAGVVLGEIMVSVEDAGGNLVVTATNSITVAIGTNPAAATLSGTMTVSAVRGVGSARFLDLSISKAGNYTLSAASPGLTGTISGPILVAEAVAAVAAGQDHTCAISTGHAAYCWGANTYGQLGNGSTTGAIVPAAVVGGLAFVSLGAGGLHSCGITNGAAACWGYGDQLGTGSTIGSSTPVLVSGGLTYQSVSTGTYHTCGVTGSGAAYCWGDNADGQLGDGTDTTRLTPTAVGGGLTFSVVSAGGGYTTGGGHTCGLTTDGVAYCWGANVYGELGNGTTAASVTPVAVSGGLTFASVSSGFRTTCGVTTSGTAYCWGYNGEGEVGDGSTTSRTTPVQVAGGLSFASVSAGGNQTCGLTTTGANVYCWGTGTFGALGNGNAANSSTPVLAGSYFVSVSTGFNHACAVGTDHHAYCWGYNPDGRLGNGTLNRSLWPVQVAF